MYYLPDYIFQIMTKAALALGPAAVNLRSAGNFAILAQSGVSTVPSSAISASLCFISQNCTHFHY